MGSCDQAHSIVQLLWTNKRNYLHFLSFNQVSMITILALRTALKKTTAKNVTGIRRVLLTTFVFNNPDRPCYTQFFVQGQPPEGLRGPRNGFTRYICQPPTPDQEHMYYATMFDEHFGIAVFSAYTLWRDPGEGKGDLFQGGNRRAWTATPGNLFTCTEKEHSPYAQGLIFEVSQYI